MKNIYSLQKTGLLYCLFLASFSLLNAQNPGTLDPDFGQNGKTIKNLSSTFELAYGCAVLPDGKIIAGGDLWTGLKDYVFATRHLPDGSLDESFSNDGLATFGNGMVDFYPYAVTVQPDGKILSTGWHYDGNNLYGFVARMLPDGSPDPGFASGGMFIYDTNGSISRFYAIDVDADGKILVAGNANLGAGNEAVVVRLWANGALDTGFGVGGTTKLDVLTGTGSSFFYGIDVLPNNGVVCAGSRSGGIGIVGRFNPDGSPFSGFGNNGLVELDNTEGNTQLYAVSVQNNNQFVVAGYRNLLIGRAFLVARLLADGALDNTFASNGENQYLIGTANTLRAVLPLADGKILAAGYLTTPPDQISRAALVRYDSDGTVDQSFNPVIPEENSGFYSLQTFPDGRILAAGFKLEGDSNFDLALASFMPNGDVDASFGDAGWKALNLRNGSDYQHEILLGTDGVIWTNSEKVVDGQTVLSRFSGDGNLLSAENTPAELQDVQFSRDFTMQPDGKLVYGGSAGANLLALGRWLPDGSIDVSFGDQGFLQITVDSFSELIVKKIAVQNDGKLLVLFDAYETGNFTYDPYVARFLPDGTLDLTWNSTGMVHFNGNIGKIDINSIRIQPDQKVLLGGTFAYGDKVYIARLLPNGHYDPVFGINGTYKFDLGLQDEEIIYDLFVDYDGRILAAFSSDMNTHSTGVLRLTPDGDDDLSFDDDGLVLVPNSHNPTAYEDIIYAPRVVVQANGRILLSTHRGANADFALYCFLSNGAPDPGFGVNGMSKQDIQGYNDFPTGMLLMPDGGIVQTGITSNGFDLDIALVRYLPNLTVGAPTPADGPKAMLVYPNPLGPSSTLKYVNPAPGAVTVQLEDSQGRTVQTCFSGWQPAGEQNIDLHPDTGLSAGWYVCRVMTGQGDVAVKVVIR